MHYHSPGPVRRNPFYADSYDAHSHPAGSYLMIPVLKMRKGSWRKKIVHLPELTQPDVPKQGFFGMIHFQVTSLCFVDTHPQPNVARHISSPPKHLTESSVVSGFQEGAGQARGKTRGIWGCLSWRARFESGQTSILMDEAPPAPGPSAPLSSSHCKSPIHCLDTREGSFPGNPKTALGSCEGSWLTGKRFSPGTEKIPS